MKKTEERLPTQAAKKNLLDRLRFPEMGVLVPLAIIMLITQVVNHNFLTPANMFSLLKSIPFIALATLGGSIPLRTGNLDISIGRVAGLAGMVFGYLHMVCGYSLSIALIGALAVGLAIGLINGLLVVYMHIDSFMVTMGTLYICGGLRYLVNGGTVITLPESFRNFAQQTPGGISWFFWIVIGVYVLIGFLEYKTPLGRKMYAVGNNKEVALLLGVKVKFVQVFAYLCSGLFASIAGIMAAIDINSAQPSSGTNWEFKAIAACVLGGLSLSGGKGRTFGVAVGVFIVFVINNIINMLAISNYWSDVFTGAVLAGAVIIDVVRQKKKIKE